MLSDHELRRLDAVLDQILPVEDGAAMRAYVRERAALQSDLYRAGLMVLEGRDVAELEAHPSVMLIVQHTAEGYYTSAAGYGEVGFRVTA